MNLLSKLEPTHRIHHNGRIFYVNVTMPSARYGGGGDTKVESFDPFAGTGVRQLYKTLTNWVQPQIGQSITPYQGQRVAGISPLQSAAFGTAGGLAPLSQQALGAYGAALDTYDPMIAQQLLGKAGTALDTMLADYDPAASQEYWKKAFFTPAMRTYEQDIMPAIMEQFAGLNAADSGALNRSLARSGEDLATNLSAQLAEIMYSDRAAQLARQQTGITQAQSLALAPGDILTQLGQVGGMGTDLMTQLYNLGIGQRGIEQEQLTSEMQKWMEGQPWNNPILQQYLSTALQQPGYTPIINQGSPGIGSELLGPLGSFLGSDAGSSLLSSGIGSLFGGISSLFGGGGAAAGGLEALAASPELASWMAAIPFI